jgi:hypothetical protein
MIRDVVWVPFNIGVNLQLSQFFCLFQGYEPEAGVMDDAVGLAAAVRKIQFYLTKYAEFL